MESVLWTFLASVSLYKLISFVLNFAGTLSHSFALNLYLVNEGHLRVCDNGEVQILPLL